jgi:hypothetical protein
VWQVYAAWTINGYIGVALLMLSKAEHHQKSDFWNTKTADLSLGPETLATQYLPAHHATHVDVPKWNLLRTQTTKFYDDHTLESNPFHPTSEIRKDSFFAQIPTPSRRRRSASRTSRQPSPPRVPGPLFKSLGAIRISEDDADLLPSVALVAHLDKDKSDSGLLQASTLPVPAAPPPCSPHAAPSLREPILATANPPRRASRASRAAPSMRARTPTLQWGGGGG